MSQNEHVGVESYAADVETSAVVAALKRDGAVIIRNQVKDQTADAVLAELREPTRSVVATRTTSTATRRCG